MRYGVTLPNAGLHGDPHLLVDLAREAEGCGWDGVFLWDTPYVSDPSPGVGRVAEAWVSLAAMAMRTERVLLGTMITPLAWRRPWLVARQAVTLDHLSGGRFVLPIGLGYVPDEGSEFAEEGDRKVRARMLDEGLEILRRCFRGDRFSFDGEHYRIGEVAFEPRALQEPRLPVWVVGAWPRDASMWPKRRSMRRALAWDGILPNVMDRSGHVQATPDDLRAMTDWIRDQRTEPFEVVWEGNSGTDRGAAVERVAEWAEAGATWWLEAAWEPVYRHPGDAERVRERFRRGPPRAD